MTELTSREATHSECVSGLINLDLKAPGSKARIFSRIQRCFLLIHILVMILLGCDRFLPVCDCISFTQNISGAKRALTFIEDLPHARYFTLFNPTSER